MLAPPEDLPIAVHLMISLIVEPRINPERGGLPRNDSFPRVPTKSAQELQPLVGLHQMIRHVLVVGRHQVRIHLGTLRRRPGPHLVSDGLQPLVQNFVMTIVELRNKETPPKLVSNRSICQTPRPVPVSDLDLDI